MLHFQVLTGWGCAYAHFVPSGDSVFVSNDLCADIDSVGMDAGYFAGDVLVQYDAVPVLKWLCALRALCEGGAVNECGSEFYRGTGEDSGVCGVFGWDSAIRSFIYLSMVSVYSWV